MTTPNIEAILKERQATHGEYKDVAATYATLVQETSELGELTTPYEQLASNVILQKVARMMNGNAAFDDHLVDIVGYATLVIREMEKEGVPPCFEDLEWRYGSSEKQWLGHWMFLEYPLRHPLYKASVDVSHALTFSALGSHNQKVWRDLHNLLFALYTAHFLRKTRRILFWRLIVAEANLLLAAN